MSLDRVDSLALLLADAAGVQAFLGVGDAIDALAAITESGHAVPLSWSRPAILLTIGFRASQVLVGGGGAHQYGEAAQPMAIFERDPADPDDLEASFVDFGNVVGVALQDVRDLAGTGTHPRLREIRLETPLQVSGHDEADTYMQCGVVFDWGTP